MPPYPNSEEDLWKLIRPLKNGCHEWRGRFQSGAPLFVIERKRIFIRRFIYERNNGKILKGYWALPDCGNTACVSPEHLKLIAIRDVVLEGFTDGSRSSVQRPNTVEDFWAKVIKRSDGCWIFDGHRNSDGYGLFRFEWVQWKAHVLSYTIHSGPVPEGFEVCHSCDNPPCVNPDHLEAKTHLENLADCKKRGRTNPFGVKGLAKEILCTK